MRVLSIDPGYERLGLAILEKQKGDRKETLLYSECFQTPKDIPHPQRLALLGCKIKEIILSQKPEALAIENLFLNTNQKTAMKVSEARGVILYEAACASLRVSEFSPPQIKSAVCGNGAADKKAVIKMVPMLVKIDKEIKYDDEYDAIAVGITYFANYRS